MKDVVLKINASFLYLFIMTIPSAYYLLLSGTIGVVIALTHLFLSLMILGWYMKSVLFREIKSD